jgi:hypothetical protein
MAEYKQEKFNQQERYTKVNGKWPHLSEYGEQFVIGTKAERKQKTEYV